MKFFELVVLSSDQSAYMLNYDYLTAWENAYGKTNVRILVAKNLSEFFLHQNFTRANFLVVVFAKT